MDDLALQSHGRFINQLRQLAFAYFWLVWALETRLKLLIAGDKQHGLGSSALVRATLNELLAPRQVKVSTSAGFLGGDYSAGGVGPRRV